MELNYWKTLVPFLNDRLFESSAVQLYTHTSRTGLLTGAKMTTGIVWTTNRQCGPLICIIISTVKPPQTGVDH